MKNKPRPPKSIGRKRRAAGWTLLVLGVLAVAVWAASGWLTAIGLGRTSIVIGRGQVEVITPNPFGGLGYSTFDPQVWQIVGQRARWPIYKWRVDADELPLPHTHDLFLFARARFPSQANGTKTAMVVHLVVLWPIPLLLWTPAAFFLRSGVIARKRATKGMCPKCGYSLAGLAPNTPCPECGRGASKA